MMPLAMLSNRRSHHRLTAYTTESVVLSIKFGNTISFHDKLIKQRR
jgi:hypothetical protein